MFSGPAGKILDYINGWVSIAGTLSTWASALVLMGVTIQIVWHGINIARGAGGSNHLLDVFAKSLRAFLVMSLALGGSAYSTNVVGLLQELRTDLANLFISAPVGSNTYALLDAGIGKAIETMRDGMPWVMDNINILTGNITGLVALVSMAFMVGCMVVYGFVATVNLLLVDFSMSFIFSLGPLFVACFAFESLARFFDSWLGAALKYTFTAIAVTAVVGVGNRILLGYCDSIRDLGIEQIQFIETTFAALGATGVLILIAMRAPELAANIVGGIGISAIGPGAAAAPLAALSNMSKGGARGAANAIAYGAGTAMGTNTGQAAAAVATRSLSGVQNTQVGQRSVAALQSISRFSSATTNMKPGSVSAAYGQASGRDVGTGVITGGGRPVGRPAQAQWGD